MRRARYLSWAILSWTVLMMAACGSATDGDGGDDAGAADQCGCSGGDEECCSIVLTPDMPSATFVVPIVAPGDGLQNYTGIVVDATGFSSGTIVVSGKVGSGATGSSLDLFPESEPYPTEGVPSGQVAWCYNNAPGGAFSMSHAFDEPATFHLGMSGDWAAMIGEPNTVEVTVRVLEDSPPPDSCGHLTGGGDGGGCTADADCGQCERCERSTGNCIARLSC